MQILLFEKTTERGGLPVFQNKRLSEGFRRGEAAVWSVMSSFKSSDLSLRNVHEKNILDGNVLLYNRSSGPWRLQIIFRVCLETWNLLKESDFFPAQPTLMNF